MRACVGMKPVAAGADRDGRRLGNEDALALRAASTVAVPPELDNPVLLPEPLSPHIAAARATACAIDIDSHRRRLSRAARAAPTRWWSKAPAAFACRCRTRSTGADLARGARPAGGAGGRPAAGLPEPRAADRRGDPRARPAARRLGRQPHRPAMPAPDDNVAYLRAPPRRAAARPTSPHAAPPDAARIARRRHLLELTTCLARRLPGAASTSSTARSCAAGAASCEPEARRARCMVDGRDAAGLLQQRLPRPGAAIRR